MKSELQKRPLLCVPELVFLPVMFPNMSGFSLWLLFMLPSAFHTSSFSRRRFILHFHLFSKRAEFYGGKNPVQFLVCYFFHSSKLLLWKPVCMTVGCSGSWQKINVTYDPTVSWCGLTVTWSVPEPCQPITVQRSKYVRFLHKRLFSIITLSSDRISSCAVKRTPRFEWSQKQNCTSGYFLDLEKHLLIGCSGFELWFTLK